MLYLSFGQFCPIDMKFAVLLGPLTKSVFSFHRSSAYFQHRLHTSTTHLTLRPPAFPYPKGRRMFVILRCGDLNSIQSRGTNQGTWSITIWGSYPMLPVIRPLFLPFPSPYRYRTLAQHDQTVPQDAVPQRLVHVGILLLFRLAR